MAPAGEVLGAGGADARGAAGNQDDFVGEGGHGRKGLGFRVRGSGFRGRAVEVGVGRPAAGRLVELFLKRPLHAVQHAYAFEITVTILLVNGIADVVFECCHVEMMYCLQRLATRAIDALDFVANMAVAVFLRKVCRGTIGSAPHLRTKLVFLFRRPRVTQIAYLNMKLAELLIHLEIFRSEGNPPSLSSPSPLN